MTEQIHYREPKALRMNEPLEVAQCISCGQWRALARMEPVIAKPQDLLGYSCKPCYLAMQRTA